MLSREIRFWDLRSKREVAVITRSNDPIFQLSFSPDDRLLASVERHFDNTTKTTTGEVKIWDLKTSKEQRSFPGMAMSFSPSGTTLAVVGNDKSLKLFDLITGQLLLTFPSHEAPIGVAFSRDGTRLCDGRTVWDVSNGRAVCALKGNTGRAEFSPDGMRLFSLRVTSRTSGFLTVWDATTGDQLASIPVPAEDGVSLHPDGWRCAVASIPKGTWIVDARPLTAQLRRQRDAHNVIANLVLKPLLKDEILDQLPQMKTISEPLRQEASTLAASLENVSYVLALAAGDILDHPDRSEEEYRRALRWIEEANRVAPNDGPNLTSLGLAYYRLGQYENAKATLQKSFEINASGYFIPPAYDLIFLAMTQYRLGEKEEARKTLARARDPKFSNEPVSPHNWREAEALIEDKPNEGR
jgi:hypothetical protein